MTGSRPVFLQTRRSMVFARHLRWWGTKFREQVLNSRGCG